MEDVEDCKRRIITVDGANTYVLVGRNFATATGPFENRRNKKPISREGAELINTTITELRAEFYGDN